MPLPRRNRTVLQKTSSPCKSPGGNRRRRCTEYNCCHHRDRSRSDGHRLVVQVLRQTPHMSWTRPRGRSRLPVSKARCSVLRRPDRGRIAVQVEPRNLRQFRTHCRNRAAGRRATRARLLNRTGRSCPRLFRPLRCNPRLVAPRVGRSQRCKVSVALASRYTYSR